MSTEPIGVKETREAIAAVAVIALRTKANLADNKLSWVEIVSYAGDIPEIRAACSGIKDVAAEIKDLDDNEAELLAADIRDILVGWGLTHRAGDVSVELVKFVVEGMQTFGRIMALPPTAEKVD